MNFFGPKYAVVYEIASPDQPRAAEFMAAMIATGNAELITQAAEQAQKLFGRAYLISLRSGDVRVLRVYDDLAPVIPR